MMNIEFFVHNLEIIVALPERFVILNKRDGERPEGSRVGSGWCREGLHWNNPPGRFLSTGNSNRIWRNISYYLYNLTGCRAKSLGHRESEPGNTPADETGEGGDLPWGRWPGGPPSQREQAVCPPGRGRRSLPLRCLRGYPGVAGTVTGLPEGEKYLLTGGAGCGNLSMYI